MQESHSNWRIGVTLWEHDADCVIGAKKKKRKKRSVLCFVSKDSGSWDRKNVLLLASCFSLSPNDWITGKSDDYNYYCNSITTIIETVRVPHAARRTQRRWKGSFQHDRSDAKLPFLHYSSVFFFCGDSTPVFRKTNCEAVLNLLGTWAATFHLWELTWCVL